MRFRRPSLRDHDRWSPSNSGWRLISAAAVFGPLAVAVLPVALRWLPPDWGAPVPVPGGTWWVLAGTVAGTGAVWLPPVWARWGFVVTLVHEMGHAFVGGVLGGSPARITIGADTSGLAVWQGRKSRVRQSISVFAGYPAPAVAGMGAVWAATTGTGWWWLLWAVGLLAVVAITMTRNWRAVVIAAATGAGLLALLWLTPAAAPVVTAGVGGALLAGAWRVVVQLAAFDRETLAGSDAGQLRKLTRVNARAVAVLMVVAVGAATAGAVWGWWALPLLAP